MRITPNLLDRVQNLDQDGNGSKRHPIRVWGRSRSRGIFGCSWRCELGYAADVFKEKFMQNHLEVSAGVGPAPEGSDFRGGLEGPQKRESSISINTYRKSQSTL